MSGLRFEHSNAMRRGRSGIHKHDDIDARDTDAAARWLAKHDGKPVVKTSDKIAKRQKKARKKGRHE